jgi:hypothetical protein
MAELEFFSGSNETLREGLLNDFVNVDILHGNADLSGMRKTPRYAARNHRVQIAVGFQDYGGIRSQF